MDLPLAFENWEMMPGMHMPAMWSAVGTVLLDDDRVWTLGRSEMSLSLYLFTDEPHPDNPRRKAVFILKVEDQVQRLLDELMSKPVPVNTPIEGATK